MPCGVATRPASAPDPAIRLRAVSSARSVDFMRIHPLTGEFALTADEAAFLAHKLLSRRCAQVLTDLFLPRAVLLTVLVPDRRHFPASRRAIAGGSAGRQRLARHG